MEPRNPAAAQLTALMIAPDRELARAFAESVGATRTFQILAELKTYPSQQVLEMRLRQLQPDVVLLDLATDLEQACELIHFVTSSNPSIHVVGLHSRNDSEAILRSLRMGASEFLCAPFEAAIQEQALGRIRRLLGPLTETPQELGKVLLFSSAKPGSGASTLAAQAALALRRRTGKRVLLADLDLMGGSLAFYLKVTPNGSLLDAVQDQGRGAEWPSLVAPSGGLHVLAAPEAPPQADYVDPARLHEFLERARQLYDWVVLDLPSIFHRLSLLALSESDQAFLVATPELASLHLARKAVNLLTHLGFGKERFQVLINRVDKRDGLRQSDVGAMFDCPVHSSFPNDYFSLDRAVTLGEPLEEDGVLGKAIADFAGRLAGVPAADKHRAALPMDARPVFSES
ncbi:MAG: P-loop NTPase [Bryobacteraceae bacterium]|jgi:pilus assembly protein CpaE